jgi:hypothetical protein
MINKEIGGDVPGIKDLTIKCEFLNLIYSI